jgi:diketogulonate reductase-like aldo/keto reductase
MANTKYPYRKTLTEAEKSAKYREEQKEKKVREACEKEIEKERKLIFTTSKAHFKKLGYDTSNYGIKKKVEKEDHKPVYILVID